MKISKLIKLNTICWEGVTACEVHLAGCNFRCPFCLNGDDLDYNGSDITEDDVMEYIVGNDDIEGVIITGGEPLVHADLYKLLGRIKKAGKKVRLHTNGSFPDRLDDILGAGLADFVSMSIKAPLRTDEYAMTAYAIVNVDDIERSIGIIMDSGVDYEFGTTVVPMHLTEKDIESICASIKGAKCYRLRQFRPGNCADSTLNQISPYKEKVIRSMEATAKRYVKKVKVSGF